MAKALHPILLLTVSTSAATAEPDSLCLQAADRAAAETGVPARLLHAITLVETQHDGAPWPWTVNIAGEGSWHPTRADAEAAARIAIAGGQAVDIGCFQINTRWHADAFPAVEAMFEPDANALYAARYLLDLHDSTGTWADSIAAYHSRDPDLGQGYLARVGSMLASLEDGAGRSPSPRPNGYPLLVTGPSTTNGSLVPRVPGATPFLGAP